MKIPAALTIAATDPSGMAGVQADLKTFARLGVHGLSVITAVIAQNRKRVLSVFKVEREPFRRQLEALLCEHTPSAVKTGVLYSIDVIEETASALRELEGIPLVVDPVFRASAGEDFLEEGGLEAFKREILPLAHLLTPNLAEGSLLSGNVVSDPESMIAASRHLHEKYGCRVLLKGGHLEGDAIDVFFDGEKAHRFTGKRVEGVDLHGSGCVLSSAITASLAKGDDLLGSIKKAKLFFQKALENPLTLGKITIPGVGPEHLPEK